MSTIGGRFFDQALATVEKAAAQIVSTETPFWRKEEPEIDPTTKAIIRGGLWGPQRAFWTLPNFLKLLVGGYGSGKTNVFCKRMLALALQNAPVPCAMVSPTYAIARQTTILTMAELLEGKRRIYGPKALWWSFNKSSHEFKIRYRGRYATITQYSGDNPLSLRGPNLAAAGIDEPFIQEQDVLEQMVARVRHPDSKHSEIILSGTPEQLNWGYELAEGELRSRYDVGVVHASTRDNKALRPDYVGRLEQAFDKKAVAAYVEGQFVNLASGLVYYGFDPHEHVVRQDVPPAGSILGAGMDFNVNPMAAVVFWRLGNRIHFFDEFELPNADTEYLCSLLKEKYWALGLREIYPDASGANRSTSSPAGRSDFWYITTAGFEIHAHAANGPRKDRYNAVNGKFNPAQGRTMLTISPKCRRLKTYLMSYAHEKMNKPEQKAMSHELDAFSYPINYLFPVGKEALRYAKIVGT